MSMYGGLADVNNFYALCERMINQRLEVHRLLVIARVLYIRIKYSIQKTKI
jgi:hypothetical protein